MSAPWTVTIGSDTFEVYGGLAALTTYINGKSGDVAQAWRDSAADEKARNLVDATRFLDQQAWMGTATFLLPVAPSNPTTLQWPRSGVTNSDGTAVDSTVVPPLIIEAAFELALLVNGDPDVTTPPDGSSNIERVDAGGGVGVTYFNPTSPAFGSASRLPGILDRLVGRYLSSATTSGSSVDGGYSGAGGCESSFDSNHGFGRWRAF